MKNIKFSSDLLFLFLLCALISGVAIAILIKSPKSFSERENRSLQAFPSISSSSLLSGEFSRQLGSFYSDQLPFRQELGYLYAYSELTLCKREVNGILVEDDELFIQTPSKSQSGNDTLISNLLSAEKLKARENSLLFLVPNSADVFCDLIPSQLSEQSKDILKAANCELSERMLDAVALSGDPEEYYYRTDHHWTTKGAYTAYNLLSERLGYTPLDEDFFTIETASDDFLGTSFSKSALPEQAARPDTISLYRYEGDTDLSITDNQNGCKIGLYDLSALEGYDKYRVFLGGNYAHISLAEKDEERQKLLLIKDSFANSLIPFLALHFDIEAVDPRYATVSQMRAICEGASESFDKILVLCSLDTISTERSYGRAIELIS